MTIIWPRKCHRKLVGFIVAVALIGVSGSALARENNEESEWVSIINLIATPEKFHGKKVFLSAYVTIEFENMSLCMAEQTVSSKDCLWLEIDAEPQPGDQNSTRMRKIKDAWRQANHQAVSIHGTFDKNDTGHFGGWSGGIKNVTRLYAKNLSIDFTTFPPVVRKRGDEK